MRRTPVAPERRVRLLLWAFVIGLVLSGATALPLEGEVRLLVRLLTAHGGPLATPGLVTWLTTVREALTDINVRYPFLAYGTDWLAFGHFVIALAFLGPLRNPVRNVWVIEFGMLACALVVPYALVMGALRGIPLWWRFIDCSFGAIGIVPLWWCRREIQRLATRAAIGEEATH